MTLSRAALDEIYAASVSEEDARTKIVAFALLFTKEERNEKTRLEIFTEISLACLDGRPRPDTLRRNVAAVEDIANLKHAGVSMLDWLADDGPFRITLAHCRGDRALFHTGHIAKAGDALRWAIDQHANSAAMYAEFKGAPLHALTLSRLASMSLTDMPFAEEVEQWRDDGARLAERVREWMQT